MLNRTGMVTLSAAVAVTASLFAATTGAIARTPNDPVTVIGHLADDGALRVHVRYADLNLASVAGESVLLRRVAFAANDVCAPFDYASIRYDHFDACVRGAKDGASGQVDQALRRAREIAETGTSAIPLAAIAVAAPFAA